MAMKSYAESLFPRNFDWPPAYDFDSLSGGTKADPIVISDETPPPDSGSNVVATLNEGTKANPIMIDDEAENAPLPLPTGILKVPAEFALRLLLASRVKHLSSWPRSGHLSKDASLVLEACKALSQYRDQGNTVLNDLVAATAKTLVGSLSDDTLLKLSLITWHFDASLHFKASSYAPSPALAHFLEQPNDETIWETLYNQYQNRTGLRDPLRDFKASHDFLLFPTLGSLSNGA